MKQVVIFTDAYGEVFTDNKPDIYFSTINGYLNNGWRVMHVQGTGVGGNNSRRGSFCFVLEKHL